METNERLRTETKLEKTKIKSFRNEAHNFFDLEHKLKKDLKELTKR
jgi:hypothetical protein